LFDLERKKLQENEEIRRRFRLLRNRLQGFFDPARNLIFSFLSDGLTLKGAHPDQFGAVEDRPRIG